MSDRLNLPGDSAAYQHQPPVVITRIIEGAPERIFDAWLQPSSLRQWMCPGDVERVDATIDPRVGGEFYIAMHERGGRTFVHRGAYVDIERPVRLVFTWTSDATNNHPSRVTVVLERQASNTRLTLTHEQLPSEESAERHRMGWTAIVDKLAVSLAAT